MTTTKYHFFRRETKLDSKLLDYDIEVDENDDFDITECDDYEQEGENE